MHCGPLAVCWHGIVGVGIDGVVVMVKAGGREDLTLFTQQVVTQSRDVKINIDARCIKA